MNLAQFVAEHKRQLLDDLKAGRDPSVGEFDLNRLKEGRIKGEPQMGTTRFAPDHVILEFIYSDPRGAATVLPIRVTTPERVVFLPVPDWVVESIWQGEIDGTYVWESEALARVAAFQASLAPEPNREWFGPRDARRRE